MVNEINWASTETSNLQGNPLDLVDVQKVETKPIAPTNNHGIIDGIVKTIAKIMWKPDPFTWKQNTDSTTTVEFKEENKTNTNIQWWWLFEKFSTTLWNIGNSVEKMWEKTLEKAKEVANDPIGSTKSAIDWAIKIGNDVVNTSKEIINDPIGSAKQAATNVWNVLEWIWEKALDNATNLANKWLENVQQAWNTVIDKTQEIGEKANNTVQEFVKLEDKEEEKKDTNL